jgi:hypothetical protein
VGTVDFVTAADVEGVVFARGPDAVAQDAVVARMTARASTLFLVASRKKCRGIEGS